MHPLANDLLSQILRRLIGCNTLQCCNTLLHRYRMVDYITITPIGTDKIYNKKSYNWRYNHYSLYSVPFRTMQTGLQVRKDSEQIDDLHQK